MYSQAGGSGAWRSCGGAGGSYSACHTHSGFPSPPVGLVTSLPSARAPSGPRWLSYSPMILAITVAKPWGRVPFPDLLAPSPHTGSQQPSLSPSPGRGFLLWRLEPCPSERETSSPASPTRVPQRRGREEKGLAFSTSLRNSVRGTRAGLGSWSPHLLSRSTLHSGQTQPSSHGSRAHSGWIEASSPGATPANTESTFSPSFPCMRFTPGTDVKEQNESANLLPAPI